MIYVLVANTYYECADQCMGVFSTLEKAKAYSIPIGYADDLEIHAGEIDAGFDSFTIVARRGQLIDPMQWTDFT